MSRYQGVAVGMMIACLAVIAGPAGAASPDAAQASDPVETQEERDDRMGWWREARFGMFIHWGVYAVAAGEWDGKPVGGIGEWIMSKAKIPIADYSKLAQTFNPEKYNAEAWVLAAKDAGMKYIVITTKHHDGFAMFKTAASPWNIVDATPYKRDPIKDLADACRKHGMRLGFYYSQNLDWTHPGGGGGDWDPSHKGDPDDYVNKIVLPQVKEILGNYGPVDVLWWDIPGGVINKPRADLIYKTVKELQPKIVMNNRLGGGYRGDTETPEQHIPPKGFPGRDWETCMTMNGTWGFKKNDDKWKSTTSLLRNLCDIASKGGNYLLNVGPTPEGEIPAASLERLKEVGQWMKDNGESIYGTSAAPFGEALRWGRVTRKGDTLYLLVFDLPKDRLLALPELKTPVEKAYMLTDREKKALAVSMPDTQTGVTVTVPEGVVMDASVTVVAVKLAGKLE